MRTEKYENYRKYTAKVCFGKVNFCMWVPPTNLKLSEKNGLSRKKVWAKLTRFNMSRSFFILEYKFINSVI